MSRVDGITIGVLGVLGLLAVAIWIGIGSVSKSNSSSSADPVDIRLLGSSADGWLIPSGTEVWELNGQVQFLAPSGLEPQILSGCVALVPAQPPTGSCVFDGSSISLYMLDQVRPPGVDVSPQVMKYSRERPQEAAWERALPDNEFRGGYSIISLSGGSEDYVVVGYCAEPGQSGFCATANFPDPGLCEFDQYMSIECTLEDSSLMRILGGLVRLDEVHDLPSVRATA